MRIQIYIDKQQDLELIAPLLELLKDKHIRIDVDSNSSAESLLTYSTVKSERSYQSLLDLSKAASIPAVPTLNIPSRDARNAR